MTQPSVTLLHHTPLWVAAHAIRQCHASHDKSDTIAEHYICTPESSTDNTDYINLTEHVCGPKDAALVERVGCKMKHESTLEHLNLTFSISDISRACLQEISRHRHMSLTVKSSRYTLSELKSESSFISRDSADINDIHITDESYNRAMNYILQIDNGEIDTFNIYALENLRKLIAVNTSNDIAKYTIPEAYKTSLTLTINVRSLRNLLALRTAPSALQEFRNLANELYNQCPDDYKPLLSDCIYQP